MSIRRSLWTEDLGNVRPGKQSRSRATQKALLDAAEHLFAERGDEATTITDIAERAGSSVGAVYHHFRDKNAIQHAVFERFRETYEQTVRDAVSPARWDGASIAQIVHYYVQFSLDAGRARPSFLGAAIRLAGSDPEIAASLANFRVALDTGLRDLILARRSEIGHQDPEKAATYVIDQLHSMLRTRLYEPEIPTRFSSRSDDEFVEETTQSVCRYLEVPDFRA
ncbi:MAG: TetR/AcrR family transcriptional regulator [Actinomycetota bacterium]